MIVLLLAFFVIAMALVFTFVVGILPIFGILLAFGFMWAYVYCYIYIYRDAQKRGMNAWLWVLIAFLLQIPVGPIVYLIARRSHQSHSCSYCGQPVDERYKVCPYCGEQLRDYCLSCGAAVKSDWLNCAQCGRRL